MSTYTISCRLTYNSNVEIEADSEDEAQQKFSEGTWDDEDPYPELVNWEATGAPKEDV